MRLRELKKVYLLDGVMVYHTVVLFNKRKGLIFFALFL